MKRVFFSIIFISLFWIVCTQSPSKNYSYYPPEKVNDGIQTGSLAGVGMDSLFIEKAVNKIEQGRYKEVHSMLIFKDGRLVFEKYFSGHKFRYDRTMHHGTMVGWDRTILHGVMSVTKSITSACIGIAVDKGFIKSVHQSIFDYLPDYQQLRKDGRDKITIEYLLTMTSGLDWNEWDLPYSNPKNDAFLVYKVDDPVALVLNKPLLSEPGTNFKYAGGCNILLGEILRNAANMDLDEFSGKYLFGPLGISPYHWAKYKNGVVDAAGSVSIKPRDMIKIGATFLNKGVWNGTRILSEEWVEKSGSSFPGNNWLNDWDDNWGKKGYGYSWWTHTFVKSGKRINMFYAAGWGGQYIMVIPDLNSVVIFTGGNYLSYRPPFEILKKYILPAYI